MSVDRATVEMAFGGAPHTPTGWTWTDVTPYVISVATSRGRDSRLEQVPPGTMVVTLDNTDGRFDPTNLSGPYTSGGETLVRPKTPIRLTVDDDYGGPTVTYPLFTGYLDDPMSLAHVHPEGSTVTLQASDALVWLSHFDLPQLVNPIEDGWPVSWRATRILTDVGMTDTNTYDVNGDTLLAPTIDGGNAMEAMANIALAEGGDVWVTSAGVLTLSDRYAWAETRRSSTQAILTDDPEAGIGVGYSEPVTAINRDLYNVIVLTNESSERWEASDATSVARYGKRTYDISGAPLKYGAPAESRVDYWLQALKDPYAHVAGCTIRIHGGDTGLTRDRYAATKGAQFELFDQISFRIRPPRIPAAAEDVQKLNISRIEHYFEGPVWEYRLGLDSGDRYDFANPFGWMELDNPSKGLDSIYVLSY